jgi:hypothetical protein
MPNSLSIKHTEVNLVVQQSKSIIGDRKDKIVALRTNKIE